MVRWQRVLRIFFFSSRRRHTSSLRDWSSDVCSSDLGGFMFHAHERFGVRVTGVNTTASQADMVRGEIERRRLGSTLQVLSDFRDARREYDKVVSIGTLEHAGRDQLAEVVRAHARILKPGGP